MRRLALFCGGFAAGIFLAQYLLPGGWLLSGGLVCLALGFGALLLPECWRKRAILCLVGAALALGWNWLYVRQVSEPMEALADSQRALTMTLTEYPTETRFGAKVTVRAEGLPGKLTYYGDPPLLQLSPGQCLTDEVYLQSASRIRDDDVTVFNSKGVFLLAYSRGTVAFHAGTVDAGQGQSVILRSGTETALVDCGSGNNWRDAGCDTADELLTMGCRRVDRVILTHFDDDHINGVEHLLARMGAETLTIPKAEGGAALDRLLELAERYGMDVETVTEETHLPFGNGELTIFPPLGVSGSNELGLTVLASAGEHDFLITGDMERATEKKLIETYELPELDVLMAGHHGSKNSTSKELLDAVTPGTVIISVGSNSYGHPAEDTLRRLARAGCDIYRTDRHGTVYLSFD